MTKNIGSIVGKIKESPQPCVSNYRLMTICLWTQVYIYVLLLSSIRGKQQLKIYMPSIAVASYISPGVLTTSRLTVGLTSPGKLVNAWTWKQQRTRWWQAEAWKARIRNIIGRIGWGERLGKPFEETVNGRERGMMDWKKYKWNYKGKNCRTRTGMECICSLVEMQNLH